jgi:DNA modification methylase
VARKLTRNRGHFRNYLTKTLKKDHNIIKMNNLMKITTLKNWDKNPRGIKNKDFERLKKQILRLGVYKPLLITKEGVVIGGNMRLKALREIGKEELAVTILDFIATEGGFYPTINGVRDGDAIFKTIEEGMLEYALSDNDRAGFYEKDLVVKLIPDFPDFDWGSYAVDLKEPQNLQSLIDENTETKEDEVPEAPENPTSKYGQVYKLGRHRLMCGDATSQEDVEKLMAGTKADMIFTDPPYNVDYEGKTKDALKIENDKFANSDSFHQFLYDAFSNLRENAKKGASIYVCHADTERINFTDAFKEAGWKLAEVIIWVKDVFVMGRQDYQWQHEPILYGWMEGAKHTFRGGRSQTTVWNIDRPKASREHPTMKPLALIVKALRNNSKEDDIVLDTFGGSGSTLMACEQTGRTCYIMELDPRYCDVIRKRYENSLNEKEAKE